VPTVCVVRLELIGLTVTGVGAVVGGGTVVGGNSVVGGAVVASIVNGTVMLDVALAASPALRTHTVICYVPATAGCQVYVAVVDQSLTIAEVSPFETDHVY